MWFYKISLCMPAYKLSFSLPDFFQIVDIGKVILSKYKLYLMSIHLQKACCRVVLTWWTSTGETLSSAIKVHWMILGWSLSLQPTNLTALLLLLIGLIILCIQSCTSEGKLRYKSNSYSNKFGSQFLCIDFKILF